MDGYRDSEEQVTEVHYREANALVEDGKYLEAVNAYKALGNYKDSEKKIVEIEDANNQKNYDNALALMGEGNFATARTIFSSLGNYEDAEKQADICSYHLLMDAYLAGEEANLVTMYNGLKNLTSDVLDTKKYREEFSDLLDQITGNFNGPLQDSGRQMYMQSGTDDVILYLADVVNNGPNTPVTKYESYGKTYYLIGANIKSGTIWRTSVTWYVQNGELVYGKTESFGIVLTPTDAGFAATDTTKGTTFTGNYTKA